MKENKVKNVLFAYVKSPKTWFYWYHNPERLEKLFKIDHEKERDYQEDSNNFTKKVWRFKKSNTVEEPNIVIEEHLADFFDAVLDEVRIKKANDFAEFALYISDNDDLAYFRNTVAKREIVADIDYNSQQDHAVHTLYNYILGWYIFEHSQDLYKEFHNYFVNKLKIDLTEQNLNLHRFYDEEIEFENIKPPENSNISIGLVHEFADVWPIASLLHDIGYILEGSLSSASPNVEHDRVKNGSKIIHDYFNHYFWKSFEVDFRVAKNIAKTLGVVVPDFRYSESLPSIGDRFCDIGSCENIRNELNNLKSELSKQSSIKEDYGLNREDFSMWKEYYKYEPNPAEKRNEKRNEKMADILYIVERVYKDLMWVGSDYGKRNLDHGVCSGLIALQALTFFRELFWGFRQNEWSNPELEKKPKQIQNEKETFSEKQEKQEKQPRDTSNRVSLELFNHIRNEIIHVPKRITIRGETRADFWFKKVLWATASSAIHSIIKQPEYRKQCKEHFDLKKVKNDKDYLKISYKDDPLAFLGFLVDGLQEWDRYKVTGRGEAAFSGTEPLQSTDVDPIHSDIIHMTYPAGDNGKKDWAKDLKKDLNKGLENDWDEIVRIV